MSVNCGCKALLRHYEYSKWFKGSKYRNGNEASLPVLYVVPRFSEVFGLPFGQNLCIWNRVDGRFVSSKWTFHVYECNQTFSMCVFFIEENENWIRMHKQSLLLGSSPHKGKSFKTVFVWMQMSMDEWMQIYRYYRQPYIQVHTNITVEFWNASFIHSTSETNFPFALNLTKVHWIWFDFVIDTILKSANSHMNWFTFDVLTTFGTHYCQLDLTRCVYRSHWWVVVVICF